MNLLSAILDSAGKIVPSVFKDQDKKLSSKRVFKLGGGGALIYTGLEFLNKAIEAEAGNNTALYAGLGCIAVGSFLAVGLSEKITKIQGVR